jgi:hypothetical protein
MKMWVKLCYIDYDVVYYLLLRKRLCMNQLTQHNELYYALLIGSRNNSQSQADG